MDFSALSPATLLAAMIVASIPILLAASGELIVEKSGVLNLGVEGMMITGAVLGFITTVSTGSHLAGVLAAASGGAGLSLIFGLLTQLLRSNQVATGLALTLFGLGLSALIGQPYGGIVSPTFPRPDFGLLSDMPFFGQIIFDFDYFAYVALFSTPALWLFLRYSRTGLILRAVGENLDAAHALGYKVVRIRILAIMFGGAMAGLGGAYLSLVRVPQWTEGMTAGAGWIALAIVVFGSWKPWRVLVGAMLFGGIVILQLSLQAAGLKLSAAYLSMSPYLVTIAVLAVISLRAGTTAHAPASLGKPFQVSS